MTERVELELMEELGGVFQRDDHDIRRDTAKLKVPFIADYRKAVRTALDLVAQEGDGVDRDLQAEAIARFDYSDLASAIQDQVAQRRNEENGASGVLIAAVRDVFSRWKERAEGRMVERLEE